MAEYKRGWRGTTYQEWREMLQAEILAQSGRTAMEVVDAAFGLPENQAANEYRVEWMRDHHIMSPVQAARLVVDMAERHEQA